jgi:signal transduction histidine kinase
MGVKKMYRRDKLASSYIFMLTAIGWAVYSYFLYQYELPNDAFIFFTLVIFLGIVEYFRFPIWRVSTSIGFPILFTIDFVFGLTATMVYYGLILIFVNILLRRPLRVVFYNPAQMIISYVLAKNLAIYVLSFESLSTLTVFTQDLLLLLITVFLYYIFNNLLIDVVLFLRPEKYSFKLWSQKVIVSFSVSLLSFLYCILMFILSNQDRGTIDVLAYTFFFSPLLGLSLLSSIIVRLQHEKKRLKALFSITSDFNDLFATTDWTDKVKQKLTAILQVNAVALFSKQNEEWELLFKDGSVQLENIEEGLDHQLSKLDETITLADRKREKDYAMLSSFFGKEIKSCVYAPLKIESKVVGVIAVGRTRTFSFSREDVQFISTVANQLAVLIKTRKLISEQEKSKILQERNRIARDIHDGIAQSLAGEVLNLETAIRKFPKHSEAALSLVSNSIVTLRDSLKEVRQSIYALRPYPTEQVGLKQAMEKKLHDFKNETGIQVNYEEKGTVVDLSTVNQKLIFDILKESLQNTKKHSKANEVSISLIFQLDFVSLVIRDNGVGFSLFDAMLKARNDPHFGILNMNEQAERCGATLHIDSKVNHGTLIKLMVPMVKEGKGDEDDKSHVS